MVQPTTLSSAEQTARSRRGPGRPRQAGTETRAQDAMLAHLEEVKETWLRLSDQSSEASATDKQA